MRVQSLHQLRILKFNWWRASSLHVLFEFHCVEYKLFPTELRFPGQLGRAGFLQFPPALQRTLCYLLRYPTIAVLATSYVELYFVHIWVYYSRNLQYSVSTGLYYVVCWDSSRGLLIEAKKSVFFQVESARCSRTRNRDGEMWIESFQNRLDGFHWIEVWILVSSR